VVFVPGALPGELVDVQITQAKKDFARGTVASIVESSAHRVAPP
jgi:23S rRNA (uracil1939-C5)-methyltransferase